MVTSNVNLGFPKIAGVSIPGGIFRYCFLFITTKRFVNKFCNHLSAPIPQASAVPPTHAATSSPPPGYQYAISPSDHAKYHGLFVNYDKDRDR